MWSESERGIGTGGRVRTRDDSKAAAHMLS
jgi:hypothetical protein